jgi:DNA-directed RNA polymerase specialized sigma24 family protein
MVCEAEPQIGEWGNAWNEWESVSTTAQLECMRSTAAKAVSRYAGAMRWLGRDELEQTALVEMCQARDGYDPTRGVDFGALMWRVAINAISRAVRKARSPMSATWHDVKALSEHRREPVEDDTMIEHTTPEDDTSEEQLNARVRARLAALVGEHGVPFALGVMSKEYSPGEVAATHNVPVRRVYKLAAQVRRAIFRDYVLFQMWEELNTR